MEDVTDVVFRHVVSEAGRPDVFLLSLQIRIATVIQREKKCARSFALYRR